MGNCHTVGPNEALVVSGEGAAGEVGLGRPVRAVWGVGWRCAWKGGCAGGGLGLGNAGKSRPGKAPEGGGQCRGGAGGAEVRTRESGLRLLRSGRPAPETFP